MAPPPSRFGTVRGGKGGKTVEPVPFSPTHKFCPTFSRLATGLQPDKTLSPGKLSADDGDISLFTNGIGLLRRGATHNLSTKLFPDQALSRAEKRSLDDAREVTSL
jgi:hypothetical protein